MVPFLGCCCNKVRYSIYCFSKCIEMRCDSRICFSNSAWCATQEHQVKKEKFWQNKCQGCSAFIKYNPGCTYTYTFTAKIFSWKQKSSMKRVQLQQAAALHFYLFRLSFKTSTSHVVCASSLLWPVFLLRLCAALGFVTRPTIDARSFARRRSRWSISSLRLQNLSAPKIT